MENYLFIVEGVQDIAFLGKMLNLQEPQGVNLVLSVAIELATGAYFVRNIIILDIYIIIIISQQVIR
ncbi:hypothetical protein LL033_19180 [Clostridium estertheticum]|uniref:hypothetical protein n=1 Tax=Clostridium estertheticum TaxID=238834 RepID=UPI001C0D48C4|nr:hypothetical protein [Clostridium estertheticum]MBU3214269.1 hypothetical protein [Clostridium estertheticum]WAG54716.1 hypothetical protein LL033_19180 [Clostridium estertheticum]